MLICLVSYIYVKLRARTNPIIEFAKNTVYLLFFCFPLIASKNIVTIAYCYIVLKLALEKVLDQRIRLEKANIKNRPQSFLFKL